MYYVPSRIQNIQEFERILVGLWTATSFRFNFVTFSVHFGSIFLLRNMPEFERILNLHVNFMVGLLTATSFRSHFVIFF